MAKIYNYKDLKIFKFRVTDWDELEGRKNVDAGLVAGLSMGDAVDRIESIYTNSNGKCSIISLDNIYELDAFDCGVLTENIIKEEFPSGSKNDEE